MTDRSMRNNERGFLRGLALTVVTLGVYAAVWHYRAYSELHDEFYLKPFPIRAYVLMLVPVVGVIGYVLFMRRFLDDLAAVRGKLGLGETVRLGEHLAWTLLGALVLVGPVVAYSRLQHQLNGVWQAADMLEERGQAMAAIARA